MTDEYLRSSLFELILEKKGEIEKLQKELLILTRLREKWIIMDAQGKMSMSEQVKNT